MLVGLPFGIIGMAIEQVFYQQASRRNAEGQSLGEFTYAIFQFNLRYTLIPFIALGVIGPDVFQIFLGNVWREAGVYAALIAPFLFMKLAVMPIASVYNVFERQGVGVIFIASLATLQVTGLLIAGIFGTARMSLALYSLGGVLVLLFLAIWIFKTVGIGLLRVAKTSIWRSLLGLLVIVPSLAAQRMMHLGGQWVIVVMLLSLALYYAVTLHYDKKARFDFLAH